MKSKLIIGIVTVLTIGTWTTLAITKNKDKQDAKNKVEIENIDEKKDETSKDEAKEEEVENNESKDKEVVDENKPQDFHAAQEIWGEVCRLSDEGKYREALDVYKTINNEEYLAKISDMEFQVYLFAENEDTLDKGEKLYKNGDYVSAKGTLETLKSKGLGIGQEEKLNDLLSKIDKVAGNDINKANSQFTFEIAKKFVKEHLGNPANYEYEYMQEYDRNGLKCIQIEVNTTNPNIFYVYRVTSDGTVEDVSP